MILTPEQLQDLGMAVFREAGVPEESSASVVEALVRAELDGLPSHGFSRIPFYVDQALSGKVKARAIPLVLLPCWWMRETGSLFRPFWRGWKRPYLWRAATGCPYWESPGRTIAAWLDCMRNGSRKRGSYH